MITAVVTAHISSEMTREEYAENVKRIADRFRTIPGLVRKNFLFSSEQQTIGGVYLWETREAADACYAEGGAWRQNWRSLYGIQPNIDFYDTAVVVDNKVGEIVLSS